MRLSLKKAAYAVVSSAEYRKSGPPQGRIVANQKPGRNAGDRAQDAGTSGSITREAGRLSAVRGSVNVYGQERISPCAGSCWDSLQQSLSCYSLSSCGFG